MSRDQQKSEALGTFLLVACIVLTGCTCYWQLAPLLAARGLTNRWANEVFLMFAPFLSDPLKFKLYVLIFAACASAFRFGMMQEKEWKTIVLISIIGILLFLLCPGYAPLYCLTSFCGLGLTIYGLSLAFARMRGSASQDFDEGFEQNTQLITNDDSINIPYVFDWKKRQYKGWINCINPFRASMVLGSPGSGKSFAIYNAFIEQQLRKGYTMFVYDYKFPDLTDRVITEVAYQRRHEGLWKDLKVLPKMYIINFDNPLKSNRCNPIHHSYITDPADTTEIADLVFKNINKGVDGKGFDFFNESAKVYLDALLWFLANYDPDAEYDDPEDPTRVTGSSTGYVNKGKYCTFPHVIELMAYNYKKAFQILMFTKGLEAKISPFSSALEGGAMEQLQGQIASAQIPMGKFVSPALYWVMSGDDFTLDINNPEEPKIVCMGNNPDRQSIYGTTLALYTSRMFKLINHKHKLKSAVLLDEVPTIFIKGLDNLIATARSNKVAIVLGAQDKSQLRRDYGEKEAEVIMTTTGNLFSGSVEGRSAKDISEAFGKEYKKKTSTSKGDSSDSVSISWQLEDILPASRIVDMTQGTFCGWIKDNFGEEISRKKFYGQVKVDADRNARLKKEEQGVPMITNLFGDQMPELHERDKTRLQMMYPQLADNEKAIYDKYIGELVQEQIDKNFNRIKTEVRDLVEKEYQRTLPLAAAYKAENGNDNNDY